MSSYEDQVRRQLEQSAAEQQCPVDDDLDAALSMLAGKKKTIGRRPSMLSGATFKTGRKHAKEVTAARKAKEKSNHSRAPGTNN